MPRDWEAFYSDPANLDRDPDPLLIQIADLLPPGRALDLACGAGRNALYLAQLGWQVTALDSSPTAIRILRQHASAAIDAQLANLESPTFTIPADTYDLIADIRFLHRPLFPQIREALRPGGLFAASIRLTGTFRLQPGELRGLFADWKVLYYSETSEARLIARKA